jgi:hypothetical protein
MSSLSQEKWSWIEGTHGMRGELLNSLGDAELAFSPGGQNVTLGELFVEIGDIEYSYTQSLKTFEQDWSYHNAEEGVQSHVSQLSEWFQVLDGAMKTVVDELTDDDVNREIKRNGFSVPVGLQLDIYMQALLIFLGKATIYFRAMNKPLSKQIQDWIG